MFDPTLRRDRHGLRNIRHRLPPLSLLLPSNPEKRYHNNEPFMPAKKQSAKLKTLRCPTCGNLVATSAEDFPFCSDRCRRIDLGKWAMGVYKISSPALDPELEEEQEGRERAN
jgi:uncharacterized protein